MSELLPTLLNTPEDQKWRERGIRGGRVYGVQGEWQECSEEMWAVLRAVFDLLLLLLVLLLSSSLLSNCWLLLLLLLLPPSPPPLPSSL